MRFLTIDQIQPGSQLAKPLYSSKGSVLLKENYELTEKILKRLKELGYKGLYVEDELSKGIVIQDIVDEELRIETTLRLEQILKHNGNLAEMKPVISDIVDNIIENQDVILNMHQLYGYHNYTYSHCVNVGIISICIGIKLNYRRDTLVHLGTAGILHDIGKQQVPITILNKKGKLTEDEFAIIKEHPKAGYQMLMDSCNLSSLSKIGVLDHHERYDGSGYPRGLKGKKISIFGRIVAVADTYDAMISDRAYRPGYSTAEAVEFLMGSCGRLYDYEVVDSFTKCIAAYPEGTFVILSDGTKGIVVRNYSDCILRPMVRSIEDKQIIDLKNDEKYLNICVKKVI